MSVIAIIDDDIHIGDMLEEILKKKIMKLLGRIQVQKLFIC